MEAGRTDKAFDDLLRERYEGHSMVPDRSLWEDINTHLHHKRINRNTHRIKQLKIAISAVAAILTGVIAYSLIKTADDKPDTQHISEIPGTRPSSVNGNGKIQLLKQNNLRNQEKSGYTDKRTPGKTNPESIKGKTGTSEKNPATNNEYPDQVFDSSFNRPVQVTSSEYHNSISIMNRDIQPGVDNIQPDSISNDSLNINGTITSALPGSMRSEINPSADTIVTVADAIKPVSKLSYQDEMAIPEIDPGLDQPGVSAFSWKRRYPAHFFR